MGIPILMLIQQGKDHKDKDIIVVAIKVEVAINTNSKIIITVDNKLAVMKEDNHTMHLRIEVDIGVVREEEEAIKVGEVVNVVAIMLELVITIIMMAANSNIPNIIKINLSMVQ